MQKKIVLNFGIIVISLNMISAKYQEKKEGSSDDLMTYSGLIDKIKSDYSEENGCYSLRIFNKREEMKYVSTNNISQTDLFDRYETNDKFSGTCTQTAVTIVTRNEYEKLIHFGFMNMKEFLKEMF